MRGEKVSGGYEVAFLYSERHRDIVLAAMQARDYFHRRFSKYRNEVVEDRMGKVRAKARRSTGFAGHKGWRIVVPTQDEMRAVEQTADYALLPLFKEGDRVRTLVELHRWGLPTTRPAGTMGTVLRVYAGDLYVTFDDQPGEWSCAPWWFEVAS